MNNFIPTTLAVAISLALTGCIFESSNSSTPLIIAPPSTGGGTPVPPSTGGGTPVPAPEKYKYDANKFLVVEPNTSNNMVKIGVVDSGVRIESPIQDAVKKAYFYDSSLNSFIDLSNGDIYKQDLATNSHGTMVANVIAAKKNAANYNHQTIREGFAKDIAELYGVRTSETNQGIAESMKTFKAMKALNEQHGVKLFNASYGTIYFDQQMKEDIASTALPLIERDALLIFSTGNSVQNNPYQEALLPITQPQLEKGWLAVTGVDDTKKQLYRVNAAGANACGLAARWCLAADYIVNSIYIEKNNVILPFRGTSASAPQVTALAARVWSKYPWMTADQVRQTVLTTATYIDDGSNSKLYNSTFGWGYFNETSAIKGPALFSKEFGNEFNANVNSGISIFSNDINGDAGLEKTGAGTLVLSGSNKYTGSTAVKAGELQVTGSTSSQMSVASGAILSGSGSVGAVTNTGIVSTEKGRLSVNGTYTQAANGTLAYGLGHYLTVQGKATLAGNLTVSAQNQQMVTKGIHDVVKADSVVGNFNNALATSTFLKVTRQGKTSNTYFVDIDFNDAATAGTFRGGISAAAGDLTNKLMAKANVQALSDNSTALTDYVANIQQTTTANQAQAVLNTNAGAIFAETPSVLLHNDTMANAQVAQRAYQVTQQDKPGVWSSASYSETSTEAKGWDKVTSTVHSFTLGVDSAITDQAIVGAYGTTYKDKSKFSESNGTSEADLMTFGVYGKMNLSDKIYLAANAQYGFGDVEFDRLVTDGVNTELSHAKSDLTKFGVYGEVGYKLMLNELSIAPYTAFSFNSVSLDDVKESSAIGVAVNDVTAKEIKAHLGARLDYQATNGLTVGGYAEYAYALNRDLPNVNLVSNVDSTIGVNYKAPSFDKYYFLYGVGFNYLANNSRWNFFGNAAMNASNSDDIQALLGVKYAF